MGRFAFPARRTIVAGAPMLRAPRTLHAGSDDSHLGCPRLLEGLCIPSAPVFEHSSS